MILRFLIAFALCGCAVGQTQTPGPCQAEIHKSDPKVLFMRISDGVTKKLADRKVLPDISDLKGKDLDSPVVIQIPVDTETFVVLAPRKWTRTFFSASPDAAQKWHYRPYMLKGEKVIMETRIRFSYKKDNVEVPEPIGDVLLSSLRSPVSPDEMNL